MAPSIIAVIGGLNMDMIFTTERTPDPGESVDALSLSSFPGGKGANTAIAAYRASHTRPIPRDAVSHGLHRGSDVYKDESDIQVYMNGAVGDDEAGKTLRGKLAEAGIDISGVHIIENEISGTCVVMVEESTGDSRNFVYQGANLKWKKALKQHSLTSLGGGSAIPDLVISHLGVSREQTERVLEMTSMKGVDTLWNPSPAALWLKGDNVMGPLMHLVVNETEAAVLSGRSIEHFSSVEAWQEVSDEFLQRGVRNFVVTLGARGVYYATYQGRRGIVEAIRGVTVVDATGAGDTFIGTYAVEYVKQKREGKWDIKMAITHACAASARTIQQLGAQESIPWADEVDW